MLCTDFRHFVCYLFTLTVEVVISENHYRSCSSYEFRLQVTIKYFCHESVISLLEDKYYITSSFISCLIFLPSLSPDCPERRLSRWTHSGSSTWQVQKNEGRYFCGGGITVWQQPVERICCLPVSVRYVSAGAQWRPFWNCAQVPVCLPLDLELGR
jgi:hypothetical protein